MGNQYWSNINTNACFIGMIGAAQSAGQHTIDSDYASGGDGGANNADGDGVGVRFVAPEGNVHVDELYFFMHTGPAGSENLIAGVTDSNSGSYATRAAQTYLNSGQCYALAASGTDSSKWIKFTISDTTALTPGKLYWAVCGRADGGAQTHVLRGAGAAQIIGTLSYNMSRGYYTTDGWGTNGSTFSGSCVAIKFSDGTWWGMPYTTGSTTDAASNQLERGVRISGLTEQLTIRGIALLTGNTNISGIAVYEGEATAPGGTIFSGFNGGSVFTTEPGAETNGGFIIPACTLSKDTVYRIVFRYGGNTNHLGWSDIEDWTTLSDAAAASYWQGRLCYTIDDGSGTDWTDYNTAGNGYRTPRMGLLVQDQVAISGGGGLMTGPGTNGGLNG